MACRWSPSRRFLFVSGLDAPMRLQVRMLEDRDGSFSSALGLWTQARLRAWLACTATCWSPLVRTSDTPLPLLRAALQGAFALCHSVILPDSQKTGDGWQRGAVRPRPPQAASHFSSSPEGLPISATHLSIFQTCLSCFTFSLTHEFTLDWRLWSLAAFDLETNAREAQSSTSVCHRSAKGSEGSGGGLPDLQGRGSSCVFCGCH